MASSYSQQRALLAITKASFKSIFKSPSSTFFSLFFPIVLIVIFGSIGGGGGVSFDVAFADNSDTSNTIYSAITHELDGTYQFNINSSIASTTQVGYSVQYEKNRYSLIQGRGLAPAIQTINGASTALPSVDDRSEVSVSGAYLQQNFKIKNKLFLTGAIRLDGSSVFGEDQRNQVFYKASGSYILSDNDFWKNLKWWNMAKIRAAYGQ